jgi:hypothetical protein
MDDKNVFHRTTVISAGNQFYAQESCSTKSEPRVLFPTHKRASREVFIPYRVNGNRKIPSVFSFEL